MNGLLLIGVILAGGLLLGELAEKVRLPRITGYLLAGIALNPRLFRIFPPDFTRHTDLVTNMALAFITFSVGGSLLRAKLQRLGRTIVWVTVCEAECALIVVAAGFIINFYLVGGPAGMSQAALFIPLSIFLAALASPTDPTATLAVVHQYRAKGEVADTIMGVAAFDDVFGIVNYSLGVGIAGAIISHGSFAVETSLLVPLARISGGVALGAAFGFALNLATRLAKRETEGELIVLIFAALALCFGAARLCHVDELLATMAMGCIVANFNAQQETVFGLLERYTEELIFVFFFTLSGMQLSFSILGEVYGLVLLFVFLRATGKVAGTALGGLASNASSQVRKFVPLGLLPQGGIVIGLALLMKSKPEFASIADVVVGIVIGATVIHEILGPIASEGALKLAGETHESDGARVDSRRTGR